MNPLIELLRLINIKAVNEFVHRIEKENWDHIYNSEDPKNLIVRGPDRPLVHQSHYYT